MRLFYRPGFYILLLLITACQSEQPELVVTNPVSGLEAEYNTLESREIELDASAQQQSGDIAAASWRQLSGPEIAIVDDSSALLTITIPEVSADTTAEFEVTLSNEHGNQVTDTTLVRIFNHVELAAELSSLDQRTLAVSLLTAGSHDTSTEFEWTLVDGDGLTFSASGETAQIDIPELATDQRYATLQVTATNGYGISSSATANVHLLKDHTVTVAVASELLSSLQAQADAISLIPGEIGDQGPVGVKGEVGETGAPATTWNSADADLWLQRIQSTPDYSSRQDYTPEDYRDFFTTPLDNYQRFINQVSTLLEEIEVERN